MVKILGNCHYEVEVEGLMVKCHVDQMRSTLVSLNEKSVEASESESQKHAQVVNKPNDSLQASHRTKNFYPSSVIRRSQRILKR